MSRQNTRKKNSSSADTALTPRHRQSSNKPRLRIQTNKHNTAFSFSLSFSLSGTQQHPTQSRISHRVGDHLVLLTINTSNSGPPGATSSQQTPLVKTTKRIPVEQAVQAPRAPVRRPGNTPQAALVLAPPRGPDNTPGTLSEPLGEAHISPEQLASAGREHSTTP